MSNKDLNISEIKDMQIKLYEKKQWSDMEPKYAKDHMLYMIEEIGECISIIKKKKIEQIMENQDVRAKFIEEFADVLMYYTEVLNRLEISSEELSRAYINKYDTNLNRDYKEEYNKYITS